MNLEEFATNKLAQELIEAIACKYLNSEGKHQPHDWSDPYKRWDWQRWYWKIWYPVRRGGWQTCIRCGYETRRLR